jgi:phage baseplate assembly protein gpV
MDRNLLRQRIEAMIDADLALTMLTAAERTTTLTTGPARNWATILELSAIETAQRWSPPVLAEAVELYCDDGGPTSLDYLADVAPPGTTECELA